MRVTALVFIPLVTAYASGAVLPRSSARSIAGQCKARPQLGRTSVISAGEPALGNADMVAAAPPTPRLQSFPCGDSLDARIFTLALPAFINFLILPVTGAVDLFFIGKLGSALAAAGQAAANQVYSTAALLTNVLPVVTVPLVAKAYAAGDEEEVKRQVGGSIFLSLVLGALVSLLVGLGANRWLLLVGSAAALPFSLPYLVYRLPGVLPDTLSMVGFSSFRGIMDTVTPLKISFVACLVNAVCNPILMFTMNMGMDDNAMAMG